MQTLQPDCVQGTKHPLMVGVHDLRLVEHQHDFAVLPRPDGRAVAYFVRNLLADRPGSASRNEGTMTDNPGGTLPERRCGLVQFLGNPFGQRRPAGKMPRVHLHEHATFGCVLTQVREQRRLAATRRTLEDVELRLRDEPSVLNCAFKGFDFGETSREERRDIAVMSAGDADQQVFFDHGDRRFIRIRAAYRKPQMGGPSQLRPLCRTGPCDPCIDGCSARESRELPNAQPDRCSTSTPRRAASLDAPVSHVGGGLDGGGAGDRAPGRARGTVGAGALLLAEWWHVGHPTAGSPQ